MIERYVTCDSCKEIIPDTCYTADFLAYRLEHTNSGIKFNLDAMEDQAFGAPFVHPAYRKVFCKNCIDKALNALGLKEE